MLQRITVPIRLEYTDETPTVRQQPVWAWVCGGFAIHRAIVDSITEGIFGKNLWGITHVNSGYAVVPFVCEREKVLWLLTGINNVSVDGLRLGDMTYEQAQAYQTELRPKLHRIIYPNMHLIGGCT